MMHSPALREVPGAGAFWLKKKRNIELSVSKSRVSPPRGEKAPLMLSISIQTPPTFNIFHRELQRWKRLHPIGPPATLVNPLQVWEGELQRKVLDRRPGVLSLKSLFMGREGAPALPQSADYISGRESKWVLVEKHQKPVILPQSPFVILMSDKLYFFFFLRRKTLRFERILSLQEK